MKETTSRPSFCCRDAQTWQHLFLELLPLFVTSRTPKLHGLVEFHVSCAACCIDPWRSGSTSRRCATWQWGPRACVPRPSSGHLSCLSCVCRLPCGLQVNGMNVGEMVVTCLHVNRTFDSFSQSAICMSKASDCKQSLGHEFCQGRQVYPLSGRKAPKFRFLRFLHKPGDLVPPSSHVFQEAELMNMLLNLYPCANCSGRIVCPVAPRRAPPSASTTLCLPSPFRLVENQSEPALKRELYQACESFGCHSLHSVKRIFRISLVAFTSAKHCANAHTSSGFQSHSEPSMVQDSLANVLPA